jgi:hypothetical protein
MTESPQEVLTEMARLPEVGTPERREWDLTIQEANELYPDWASISIGKARFGRTSYEKHYKEYYSPTEGRRRPRPPRPSPARSAVGSP